jgi:hypothetical protein
VKQRRFTPGLIGTAVAAILSTTLAGCGNSASSDLTLSRTSGAPGTEVTVSGKAGLNCSAGSNWFGFSFQRSGEKAKGPSTEMTTPVLVNGSWSATFAVPAYLGGSASRGPGGLVRPGLYQLVAKSCKGGVVAKASFTVTTATPVTKATDYIAIAATQDGDGYWVVQADGGVRAFGDARSYGSLRSGTVHPGTFIVAMARTYDAHGYWLAGAVGHVYAFGDANDYGSLSPKEAQRAPVTSIAATPNGLGYWLLGADGHVYSFGDARPDGMPNSYFAPYDAIGTRPAGGYLVTAASNAAVYQFTGGTVQGGGPGTALSATLVGTAVTPSGNGAWEAGTDGGVVTIGDAAYYGSVPGENEPLPAPVTGIAGAPDGHGYWLVGADGTVFNFGSAQLLGSPTTTGKARGA